MVCYLLKQKGVIKKTARQNERLEKSADTTQQIPSSLMNLPLFRCFSYFFSQFLCQMEVLHIFTVLLFRCLFFGAVAFIFY